MSNKLISREEALLISLKMIEQCEERKSDEVDLLQTFDAAVWASEFCNRHPDAEFNDMVSWFASALMTGYDFRRYHMEQE